MVNVFGAHSKLLTADGLQNERTSADGKVHVMNVDVLPKNLV